MLKAVRSTVRTTNGDTYTSRGGEKYIPAGTDLGGRKDFVFFFCTTGYSKSQNGLVIGKGEKIIFFKNKQEKGDLSCLSNPVF